MATSIEWTDDSWNPTRGCSRVSEGCRNCYAEVIARRFAGPGRPFRGYANARGWTGKVSLIQSRLYQPLTWKTPRRVFVNSMSDLFHESLPEGDIRAVLEVMRLADQHTFQVLTKRPMRMRDILQRWLVDRNRFGEVPPNIWLGISAEDQGTFDARISYLLDIPAAVHFVSYEPALDAVDFRRYLIPSCHQSRADWAIWRCLDPTHWPGRIDWLIIGGESGPHARPFRLEWARTAINQCRDAGVAVFLKQLGSRPFLEDGPFPYDRKVYKSGDPQHWPDDLRVREFPTPRVPYYAPAV